MGQISCVFSLVTIFREQHLKKEASHRFHLLFPALVPKEGFLSALRNQELILQLNNYPSSRTQMFQT